MDGSDKIGRGYNLLYGFKPPPVGRRAAGRSGRACGLSGPVPPGRPAAPSNAGGIA